SPFTVRGSKIMTRIRQVERLVDEREIGNDIADHRVLQHRPVVPRRIVGMAAAHAAARAALDRDENLAAPALDPAYAAGALRERRHFDRDITEGQALEHEARDPQRFEDLLEAHG